MALTAGWSRVGDPTRAYTSSTHWVFVSTFGPNIGTPRDDVSREIEHRAARVLLRWAQGDRASARRVDAAIRSLADDPRPPGATKLTGLDAWRVRVGDHRVVYVVEEAVRVVTVTRVGPPSRRLRQEQEQGGHGDE